MLENFFFIASCAFFFMVLVGLVVMVDFMSYMLLDFSLLMWLERVLYDKLGS